MLTAYRRRFVAITMALIALVLLLALIMQGIVVYRNEYQDMRRTMGMVLEPWRMVGDDFRPGNPGPGQRPEDDDFAPDEDFEPDDDFDREDTPPMGRFRDARIRKTTPSPSCPAGRYPTATSSSRRQGRRWTRRNPSAWCRATII